MPVDELVMCRCNSPMQTTVGGAKYCENCDSSQPQEYMGFARRKTREDIRFDMYWLKQIEQYEDNTKPKAGPDNGKAADSN